METENYYSILRVSQQLSKACPLKSTEEWMGEIMRRFWLGKFERFERGRAIPCGFAVWYKEHPPEEAFNNPDFQYSARHVYPTERVGFIRWLYDLKALPPGESLSIVAEMFRKSRSMHTVSVCLEHQFTTIHHILKVLFR